MNNTPNNDAAVSASWAIARSEELSKASPLAVDCGEHRLVLWRDASNTVRALEDRCPHRRVELSLGSVLDNGLLRCGYHGWSFDGATGCLKNIPNIPGQDKFSPAYRAKKYHVWEEAGFVRLTLNDALSEQDNRKAETSCLSQSGTSAISVAYDDYMDIFFDAPWLLFSIPGVTLTEYFRADLHEQAGMLVTERYCNWAGWNRDTKLTGDFPLVLRSSTQPLTGETTLTLSNTDREILLLACIAPMAANRNITTIRWRAELSKSFKHWRRLQLNKKQPLKFHKAVDAFTLRQLSPSASVLWRKLSTQPPHSSHMPQGEDDYAA